jgi:glycosyltransferase involved in cell wall biosynthesis
MSRSKLLIVVNDVPFFLSHRLPIAVAALARGYDVAVAAPVHQRVAELTAAGVVHIGLPMPRKRGSLLGEVRAIHRLWKIVSTFRPDVAHLITAKPIIFGGALCRIRGIPVLAAISGLGHVFVYDDFRSRVAKTALLAGYRFALKRRHALAIFQNRDNLGVFQANGIANERSVLIRGSGTDLSSYDPTPPTNDVPTVLLPARMLWTKGVGEFVEAARILKSRGYKARFLLAGSNDPGNPANIDEAQLQAWADEGAIEWIGFRRDMADVLKCTDVVVLPSYLEGLPKTIVDAAAAGRPTVTTNVPGCRDAVIDGRTGLLCEARDPHDLAEKIATLLDDPERRELMGQQARSFAVREFDIQKVVEVHLECYQALLRRDLP